MGHKISGPFSQTHAISIQSRNFQSGLVAVVIILGKNAKQS